MKRLLLLLLPLSLLSLASSATTFSYIAVDTSADALFGAQVEAAVQGGAAYVWADMTQGKSRTRTYLTHDAGDHWVGCLPPCHSGSASVSFFAEDAEGAVVSGGTRSFTLTENTTDGLCGMTEQRKPSIHSWVVNSSGNGFTSGGTGWAVRDANKAYAFVPLRLKGALNEIGSIPEGYEEGAEPAGIGGFMETTDVLTNGIGSIWLKARMSNAEVGGGRAALDLVRKETIIWGKWEIITFKTEELVEFEIPERPNTGALAEWQQFHFTLQRVPTNETDQFCLRIRNKTLEGSNGDWNSFIHGICVMDVVITPPIPDVAVSRDELDYAPGFPNVRDPISFHVAVSNRWDAAPVTAITPRLVWRQNLGRIVGAWHETVMTNTLGRTEQGDGIYACTLEPGTFRAGEFEYFYDVSFGGYTPRFPAITRPNSTSFNKIANERFDWNEFDYLIHTNALGVLASADASDLTPAGGRGSINEGRSPAYSPTLTEVYGEVYGASVYETMTWDGSIVPGTPAADFAEWDYTSKFDPRELNDGWPTAPATFFVHNGKTGSSGAYQTDVEAVESTVEIPWNYSFLTFFAPDGIRNYRSANDGLALATAPWSGSGATGLQSAYPMTLVGDYTWMAIVRVTNEIDVAMCPTSAWHYVDGETAYQTGPYVWLERNQDPTAVNPPTAGTVQPAAGTPGSCDLTAETGFEIPALRIGETDGYAASRLTVSYDGHLMYRLCATNGAYEIRRATWQDFNGWTADTRYFQLSHGLENQKTFPADGQILKNRAVSTDSKAATVAFQRNMPAGADDSPDPVATARFADGVLVRNAWIEEDEDLVAGNDTGTSFVRNKLVRLSTLPSTPGSVETTVYSKIPGGRGEVKFKVRASARDTIAAYYEPGLSWTAGSYSVYALVSDAVCSLATNAHVSVYADWKNETDNLEARLVQHVRYVTGDASATPASRLRRYLVLELVRTLDGEETVLASTRYPASPDDTRENGGTYALGAGWVVALEVADGKARALLYEGTDFLAKTVSSPATPKAATSSAAVTVSPALTGGTVAVNAFEAAADFSVWAVAAATFEDENAFNKGARLYPFVASSGATAYGAAATAGADAWKQATGRYWNYREPWSDPVQGSSATEPTVLSRPVPAAHYRVQVYRTDAESTDETVAPVPTYTDDWTDAWDDVGGHAADGIRTATSFDWETVAVPMHFWDDTFVRILALPDDGEGNQSTAFVSVDDVESTSWLGRTVLDPSSADLSDAWIGTFATIAADGREGRQWKFERTRANPKKGAAVSSASLIPSAYTNLAQALLTPLLADGVGDFTFEYAAEGTDVPFVVELINERTGSVVNDASFSTLTYTGRVDAVHSETIAVLRPGFRGRLRIRPLADASSLAGSLLLRNLQVTDYPAAGETSWEAYNALVSTFKVEESAYRESLTGDRPMWSGVTNELSKFDRDSDRARSAVLNDEFDAYTLAGTKLGAHAPFIQTAAIETGIGEVGFWYRLAPGESKPGRIRLLAAKSASTPDSEWIELTEADLNGDPDENPNLAREIEMLAAITNITTDTWTYFSAEFFQHNYNVLRLCATGADEWNGTDTDAGRVMIDNVIVTEPVRSSIDVGTVEFCRDDPLSPGIPLSTAPSDVRVTLVNPRRDPKNIRVRLEWFRKSGPKETLQKTIVHETVESEEVYKSETVLFPDGVERDVWYWDVEVNTNVSTVVAATRVPRGLQDKWGYDNWSSEATNGATRGSIALTNAPAEGKYVFLSSEPVPTDRFGPDEVVQYCVVVEYDGRFNATVYSEKQGRVSDGFWFENPDWYRPIDLNELYGTTNRPAAHFWTFSVGTNLVSFNEIRTAARDRDLSDDESLARKQLSYVELLGPTGADVTGWRIRTAAVDDDDDLPVPGEDWWTNTLASATTGKAVFREADNATTNIGWGVYLLGGEEVENRDQILVPSAADDVCVYFSDALVLERPMGAWVERVCWSQGDDGDVDPFIRQGYEYLGSIAYRERGSRVTIPTYTRLPDPASENFWATYWQAGSGSASSITPGGFNQEQEENLPDILRQTEEPPVPLISQPVVTAFDMGSSTITLSFSVRTTNDVALAAEDFRWYVATSTQFENRNLRSILPIVTANPGEGEVLADKTIAGEAGVDLVVTVSGVPVLDDENDTSRFYWIVATPTRE